MTRRKWLKSRLSGLGASDVPTLFWANPYDTPNQLWYSRKNQEIEDLPEHEDCYWGHRLEPLIAEEYQRRTRHSVRDPGQYASQTHRHLPCLFATTDRVIETADPGALELKFTDSKFDPEWITGAPLRYQIQLQVQMEVYDFSWGVIAGLCGKTFKMYRYDRNQRFGDTMKAIVNYFWESLENDDPPPFMSRQYLFFIGQGINDLGMRLSSTLVNQRIAA